MSLGGVTPVENRAKYQQVSFDAGANKAALAMSNAADISTIPV